MAALSLVLSAAAVAQTERDTGSNVEIARRARLPDNVGMSEAERGRIAMAEFARCTIMRNRAAVGRALALPSFTQQEFALGHLASSECLDDGRMSFGHQVYRRALLVELYRRQQRGEPGLPAVASLSAEADRDTVHRWLISLARCVVDRDTGLARQFAITDDLSLAEAAALRALLPDIGPCISAGQTMTLSRPVIKGALAEVLYVEQASVEPASASINGH